MAWLAVVVRMFTHPTENNETDSCARHAHCQRIRQGSQDTMMECMRDGLATVLLTALWLLCRDECVQQRHRTTTMSQ